MLYSEIKKALDGGELFIPKEEFGDLATNVLMKKGDENKEEIIKKIEQTRIVEKIVEENGFLNIFLNRKKALSSDLRIEKRKDKVVLEHTSVNPNKELHIGHFRNSVLGDGLKRVLGLFYDVEVQNYIDDMGLQVAISIYEIFYFYLGLEKIEKIKKGNKEEIEKFFRFVENLENIDEFLSELYPKGYGEIEKLEEKAKEILKEMEIPDSGFNKIARKLALKVLEEQTKLLKKCNITFDYFIRESDLIGGKAVKKALELLEKEGKIKKPKEGKYKGCVVLELSEKAKKKLRSEIKVLVKSDGSTTYVLRDISYHLWKINALKNIFGFERFFEGKISNYKSKNFEERKKPGLVINVIDARQRYPQECVKYSLSSMGFLEEENYIHYAYEVVALEEKEERKIKHMSGRKGIGVSLKEVIEFAKKEILEKMEKKDEKIAEKVAISAIKFEILKQNKNKMFKFSLEKALDFKGDSGVYLLYTLARAKKILKKAEKQKKFPKEVNDVEWSFLRDLALLDYHLEKTIKTLDLSYLASVSLKVARAFNEFYQKERVIGNEKEEELLFMVDFFVKRFSLLLNLLGFEEVDEI